VGSIRLVPDNGKLRAEIYGEFAAVGPENSCGAPKVVMMQSMGRWELDYLALFGWMDRSAVG